MVALNFAKVIVRYFRLDKSKFDTAQPPFFFFITYFLILEDDTIQETTQSKSFLLKFVNLIYASLFSYKTWD